MRKLLYGFLLGLLLAFPAQAQFIGPSPWLVNLEVPVGFLEIDGGESALGAPVTLVGVLNNDGQLNLGVSIGHKVTCSSGALISPVPGPLPDTSLYSHQEYMAGGAVYVKVFVVLPPWGATFANPETGEAQNGWAEVGISVVQGPFGHGHAEIWW